MGAIRKTASKAKLKAAFIELLATKGFEKMTVSDLTKTAKINRGTFYLNYVDKYELWSELKTDFLLKLGQFY